MTTGLLAVIGSLAALSNSTLADVTLFGMTFFELFDFATSNVFLPVGGLLIAIFAGWIWGAAKLKDALSNHKKLKNNGVILLFTVLLKFVTPVLVLIVLLDGLDLLPF